MWGFSAREAEIMLAQHSSPYTHPLAGLVECWEAPGMRPSSQGVSGGTEAVKSCLSPFLQTISDISLDNTTLSPCRPQPPLLAPPQPLQLFILGL